MAEHYRSTTWTIQLPDTWIAASHNGYVEIRLSSRRAWLRVTPHVDESGRLNAAEWLAASKHFAQSRGRPITSRRCGDFAGYETGFPAGGVWVRSWALAAGDVGLDIGYSCEAADAGKDDSDVDAVLSTLRIAPPAT